MNNLHDLIINKSKLNKGLYYAILEKDVEKVMYIVRTSYLKEISDSHLISVELDIDKIYEKIKKEDVK